MSPCVPWAICLVLLTTTSVLGEQVSIPVTQDNSIVMVDGEWTENAGSSGRIRIKGNQHMVAMAFDTSAIAGRRVKSARLECHQADQVIAGVTVSTIAAPWTEARSNALTAGIDGLAGWGYPGARFPAVAGGNAHALVHSVPSVLKDGVYHWEIPADMVHALATGVAFGLAIHEYDADYSRNPTIFSREQSGKRPQLIVELDTQREAAPKPPTKLKLVAVDNTTARLELTGPASGFAYDITVNGSPLGRHNTPLVQLNQPQVIWLRDLPEGVTAVTDHVVQVVTLNRTGQKSQPVTVRERLFHHPSPTALEVVDVPATSPPIANLSVIPLLDKYDQQGNPVGSLPADYRTHNSIYNGARVQLIGARGEVVGFQVIVRGEGEVTIQAKIDGPVMRTDLFQALYVPANGRLIPDPLLPLPEQIPLKPDADQAVFVDLYVPFDAEPGLRTGAIQISDGRQVPIELEILPFSLPRKATFFCEMNGYGLPDHVQDYYALQQVAYDHRVHANILHYSHNSAAPGARKSNLDMRLPSGKRMDNRRYDDIAPGATAGYWDDFVTAFGPYIDGSLFQNGHRGPIPAPGFYLTFHESWPLNCRAHFNGNPDAYEAFREQPLYAETYVNILEDFARLAQSKGWTDTGFQVYFNNKGSLNEKTKAPWILDEPSGYWDYRALQYYGELTDRGRAAAPGVRIDYRIDISRPEYCRGQLDQRSDLWVVSTWAFQNYRRLVTDRMEQDQLKAWVYGSSNHVHETNRNIQAWALDSWRHGATGLVPWQTVNKDGSALTQADQLGLFIYHQSPAGQTVIRHSARLKAFRESQQLIEYLNLLAVQKGWTGAQIRQFLSQFVQLDAAVHKTDDADAGTTSYATMSPSGAERLRKSTARMIRNPQ
jgi:hypothetical protein